ncbi:Pentalenene synthase [Streptomyces sp. YIM 121038]|uniref:terpene synthase family protein n=1 Tax=Streptomyces sp. YIM 121038 TaxID=2136401 RepID=UPI001110B544|nr:terpene synthase family protein [Streptomyces sp. YIM 121038]QCX74752.1 Pentalenene synthase [Streptomyces sp. YIM 121038]
MPDLPAFRYPPSWGAPRNHLSHALTDVSLRWGDRVGLPDAPPHGLHAMGRGLNMGAYAGWIHPLTSNIQLLQLSSDFALWITVLDDALERLGPTLKEKERVELADACAEFFEGPTGSVHPVLAGYVTGYQDVKARARDLMPSSRHDLWQDRLHYELKACNRVSLTEEPLAAEQWMGLDFYAKIRPFTPGVLPFMPLLEIADDCFIPQTAWEDPRLRKLEENACLLFGMFNDVASLEKDDNGGPAPNVVLMHQHENACTLSDSIEAIAQWHNTLVRETQQCTAELLAGHRGRPAVERYVHSVQHLVAGIANWHLHAPRYGPLLRTRATLLPAPELRNPGQSSLM